MTYPAATERMRRVLLAALALVLGAAAAGQPPVATRFLEIRKGRLVEVEDPDAFFDSQVD